MSRYLVKNRTPCDSS